MDVSGVGGTHGSGLTGAELANGLRAMAGVRAGGPSGAAGVTQTGDTVNAIRAELLLPEVAKFLESLDRPPSHEMAARIEGLISASLSAAAAGDGQRALEGLREAAALHPRRAETLELEPGLAPIRGEVGRLMIHLASAAHMDAELRLGQASGLLQAGRAMELLHGVRPDVALMIAGNLHETGGYANDMRSIAISQMVIDRYGWTAESAGGLAAVGRTAGRAGRVPGRSRGGGAWRRWAPRVKRVWERAPLLILLLGWFALGLASGSTLLLLRRYWPESWPETLVAEVFQVWGLGLVALVGFGFYMRIRNIRW